MGETRSYPLFTQPRHLGDGRLKTMHRRLAVGFDLANLLRGTSMLQAVAGAVCDADTGLFHVGETTAECRDPGTFV